MATKTKKQKFASWTKPNDKQKKLFDLIDANADLSKKENKKVVLDAFGVKHRIELG